MAAADVAPLRERTMNQISGGERMRVLLARALAVEAPMLLADEPVAALDPLHQLQVMDLLRQKAASGGGVVVVLHDLALAARFCDRLVLLDRGRVLASGDPGAVLTDANIAAAFGVDVVRGEHDGAGFVLPWSPSKGLSADGQPDPRRRRSSRSTLRIPTRNGVSARSVASPSSRAIATKRHAIDLRRPVGR